MSNISDKAARKRYRQTPKGKAATKRAIRKWREKQKAKITTRQP